MKRGGNGETKKNKKHTVYGSYLVPDNLQYCVGIWIRDVTTVQIPISYTI